MLDKLKLLLGALRKLDREWESGRVAEINEMLRELRAAHALFEAGLEESRREAEKAIVAAARRLVAAPVATSSANAHLVEELDAAITALDAIP